MTPEREHLVRGGEPDPRLCLRGGTWDEDIMQCIEIPYHPIPPETPPRSRPTRDGEDDRNGETDVVFSEEDIQ